MKHDALSYVYLGARLSALRRGLTSWDTVTRMAETGSSMEAERLFFARRGTAGEKGGTAAVLEEETAQIYQQMAALNVGGAVLDLFRFPWDCHNAKVLLRRVLTGAPQEEILSRCGAVPPEKIEQAVQEENPVLLPRWLRSALAESRRMWRDTANMALVDRVLDRACFAACAELAGQSGSPLAAEYVALWADGANLQILLRMPSAAEAAVEEWLLPGGVSPARLLQCRRSGKLEDAFSDPLLRRAARRGTAAGAEQALCRMLCALGEKSALVSWGPEVLLGFLLQLRLRQDAVRFVLVQLRIDSGRAKERLEEWYG